MFTQALFNELYRRLCAKERRKELGPIALYKDKQDDQWEHIGDISTNPARKFDAVTAVGFLDKVVPTPAAAPGAEEQINQGTEWQQVVADDKVLEVLNVGGAA